MGQYDIIDILASDKNRWFTREEIESRLPHRARCNTTLYKLRKSGFFVRAKPLYTGKIKRGYVYQYK